MTLSVGASIGEEFTAAEPSRLQSYQPFSPAVLPDELGACRDGAMRLTRSVERILGFCGRDWFDWKTTSVHAVCRRFAALVPADYYKARKAPVLPR